MAKKRIADPKDKRMISISVPEYHRNLSLSRILSHITFAIKLLFNRELREADIIFCSVPPNLVLLPVTIIRIFRPQVKVVCDIVDLWPEAIPLSSRAKDIFSFFASIAWVLPRNLAYKISDLFISHCEYFLKTIGPAFLPPRTVHLPLCLMDLKWKETPELSLNSEIRFLLLGSVNNIFDLEKCVNFFRKLNQNSSRKIVLEIIGLGESLNQLINTLKIEVPTLTVINHGPVFDRHKKDEIMSGIHFGLNLYKNTTAIGVSYKSIEYMAHGIPLINSAQGDLYDLIINSLMGFNVIENLSCITSTIGNLEDSQYQKMRSASSEMYLSNFSREAFEKNLLKLLKETT